MSDLSTYSLVAAGLQLATGLVFAVVAPFLGGARQALFPDAPVLRRLPHPTWFFALLYFLKGGFLLLPAELWRLPPWPLRLACAASHVLLVVGIAQVRQILALITTAGWHPDRRWLARNYFPALVLSAIAVAIEMTPAARPLLFALEVAVIGYVGVMGGAMLRYIVRVARPGRWVPGGVGAPRSRDAIIWSVALGLLVAGLLLAGSGRGELLYPLVYALVGLLFLAPVVAMAFAMVLRGLLFALCMIVATGTVYLAAREITARAAPGLQPVIDVGAVLALLFVLGPLRAWLPVAIDALVFHRTRRRAADLQAIAQTLSPELGAVECCRRALLGLGHIMQTRGAAIVFLDGSAVAHGLIALDRVQAAWPAGAAAERLPARVAAPEFGVLSEPLQRALVEAEVLGMVAIASRRRCWGHLLLTTSMLGTIVTDDDVQALLAFTDQLALVLDGADLLERALAVERSLAHAEKLAAIGELAARIAHEIRNPVTAARSLAQQLAHEPGSPFAVEHGLILVELERVERQVASLLRFARREEFRFGRVDLGELVARTIADLRPRLDDAGIDVTLERASGLTSRADPEKIRQVLVNLIENSIDALRAGAGSRRIDVDVSRRNGSAAIRVTDSGPGVPPDALGHLFEPFFSLKEHGTGLGLAIAKRTIDAHGGRIAAEAATPRGMSFEIELPLVGERSETVEHATGEASA
jgi:signal transduction histidine kinase